MLLFVVFMGVINAVVILETLYGISGWGLFFFSSRRGQTRCALVTGVQTCALPNCSRPSSRWHVRWAGSHNGAKCCRIPITRSAVLASCTRVRKPATCRPSVNSRLAGRKWRSEEHTSELQSLMRISYAVFCLKKKKNKYNNRIKHKTQDDNTNIMI